MWSSRLFWKVFLGFVGLIVLSAAVFGYLVTEGQENQVSEQLRERLRVSAVLLGQMVRESLDSEDRERLQVEVRRLGQETQTRFTVVDLNGTVLADSGRSTLAEVKQMDNHRNRPELLDAANIGTGASERYSDTMKSPLVYYALRIERDDRPVGLARAALPVQALQQRYQRIRSLVVLWASLVTVVAMAVGYFLVARIIKPLMRLTHAAERIADGQDQSPIDVSNQDEIGTLAKSFNRMNSELSSRIGELRERGEQLAAVLGGMGEGVIAVDDQARILFANGAAGKLFEFDANESRGRPLLSTIRDEVLRSSVQEAIESRRPVFNEIELRGPKTGTLAVRASPLPGEPCPGVVLVLDDRTELVRLESLRQEFVANVSHELKTPLSSIKAYAETLRNGAIHDDQHNVVFVQRIEDQADRLHQLILDLLSIARIESGQKTYETANVNVLPVAEACLDRLQPVAESKQIRLRIEENQDALVLRTDEEALREILDNLVNNGIKYTPAEGEIVLRWRTDGEMGVIEVTDTGIGIAEEDQERLFERFFRVDKARSREMGGTGLGLSIVKHLSQFFGGNVGVTSELQKGSTFWVRLPLG